ncbi:hypothetical protein D3C71_2141040 [compost metagenome]
MKAIARPLAAVKPVNSLAPMSRPFPCLEVRISWSALQAYSPENNGAVHMAVKKAAIRPVMYIMVKNRV